MTQSDTEDAHNTGIQLYAILVVVATCTRHMVQRKLVLMIVCAAAALILY